jgi:hypothetical protein
MVQDKWRKEEAHRHIGNRPEPVKDHVSSDVSYPQLQARTPFRYVTLWCRHFDFTGLERRVQSIERVSDGNSLLAS